VSGDTSPEKIDFDHDKEPTLGAGSDHDTAVPV